jgi:hypothetical protein
MAPAIALASPSASPIDAARPQATSPAPASVVAIAASRCLVLAGVRAYLGGSSLLSTGDP